jgi:signal transduction histidine kinase
MITAMATLPRTEHAVARRLAGTADPRAALARALAEIGVSMGWPFGALWETPQDSTDALHCTEVWHDGGYGRADFERASRDIRFAAGEGLPGRSWLTGKPVWIANVLDDDNFPRAAMADKAGLLCAVAFPIRSARGVLGVLEFFSPETRTIDIDIPGPPMFTAYLRDITDRKAAEAELRASRARIVAAADSARRKIERDLHDGAQQRLVEMALDLRMAQATVGDGNPEARELIQTAIDDLRDAIGELRELARGIHPAALTEGGLKPALDGLLSRCKIPATLVGVPDKRYPESVEVTAYFVVAEALTNVTKYAEASHVDVEVRCRETTVEVIVSDDGNGGADPSKGSGLRGLADRVEALGGRLQVESPPGSGTTVRARVPTG